MPAPDATFDWVLSNSVLEHVDEIAAVLAETGRVLRDGGLFIFTVPSTGFHEALRGPLLPGRDRAAHLSRIDARLYHRRYWDAAAWSRELAPWGLSVVSAREYMGRRRVRRWELISSVTAGLLYLVWGRRTRPIEIQRRLGLRSRRRRLPGPLAWLLSLVLGAGLGPQSSGPYGCLLVVARKQG